MFPFCFEWEWSIGYLIFFGLLYMALAIIGCGLTYCLVTTWLRLPSSEEPSESPPELSYRSKYSQY